MSEYHGNTEDCFIVQSVLSDYDDSIMKLIWVSHAIFAKEKDKWETQIFKRYPTVNTINHIDEERALIGITTRENLEKD